MGDNVGVVLVDKSISGWEKKSRDERNRESVPIHSVEKKKTMRYGSFFCGQKLDGQGAGGCEENESCGKGQVLPSNRKRRRGMERSADITTKKSSRIPNPSCSERDEL